MLLQILFLLSYLVSFSILISSAQGVVLNSYKCPIQSFTSPYPAPTHTLAVPDNNQTYFYSAATGSTITLYPSTFPGSNDTSYYFNAIELTQPTTTTSPCFTTQAGGITYSLAPAYGQSIDQQLNTIVIGTPNKIVGANISFIDIVTLTGSSPIPSLPISSTIWAYDSEQLGLAISLSSTADILAAYHDTSSIILYSPVVGRVQQQYNTISDQDVYITVPVGFYTDTILLEEPTLFVTGVTVTGTSTTATLLIYTLTGTLSSTVYLTRVAANSPLNTYSTLSLPSSFLPVASSNNRVVVGIPAWEAVYTCLLPSCGATLTYLQNLPSQSSLTNFGSSVLILDQTVIIASNQEIINLNYITFLAYTTRTSASNTSNGLNILDIADSIYPNRKQSRTYDEVRNYLSVEGNDRIIVGLVTPDPFATSTASFSPFFNIPITPIGFAFSADQNNYFPCVTGSYSFESSFLPCQFCPVGFYTSSTGSTGCQTCDDEEYCPTGSTYPYSMDFITDTPTDDLPDFEADSLAESYEELLINTIFQPTTIPMIICWIFVGLTLIALMLVIFPFPPIVRSYAGWVLALYRFAQVPEEEMEEEIMEKKMKKIAHLENEIHEAQMKHKHKHTMTGFNGNVNNLMRPPSPPVVNSRSLQLPQSSSIEPPSPTPSNPHTLLLKKGSSSPPREAPVENPSPSDGSRRGSITAEEKKKAEEDIRKEGEEEQIIKGFFNIVLALFAISAISFSLVFLDSYVVEGHEGEEINRYTSEQLDSVSVTDPVLVAGLDAINAVNATINVYLIGYSGMECDYDGIVGLLMEGCIILQNNQPCNNSETVTVFPSPDFPFTCVMSFNLIQGTLLSNLAVMTLLLPPSTHMQAMRLEFIQDPQDTVPGVLGTGPTNFFETVTQPVNETTGVVLENAINRYIFREWIFGIVAWSYQTDDATPPDFFYRWYNTVTSVTTQYFPTLTLQEYNVDTNGPIQIILSMTTETVFRLQTTEKLIQVKAAFLTILLALIAIFHVVGFGKEVLELTMNVSSKLKKSMMEKAEDVKEKALAAINIQKDSLFNNGNKVEQYNSNENQESGETIQLVRSSSSSHSSSSRPLQNAASRMEHHRPSSVITVSSHRTEMPAAYPSHPYNLNKGENEEERKEEKDNYNNDNETSNINSQTNNYDYERAERIRAAQQAALRAEAESPATPNLYQPPPFAPFNISNINTNQNNIQQVRASPRDLPPVRPGISRQGSRDIQKPIQ